MTIRERESSVAPIPVAPTFMVLVAPIPKVDVAKDVEVDVDGDMGDPDDLEDGSCGDGGVDANEVGELVESGLR